MHPKKLLALVLMAFVVSSHVGFAQFTGFRFLATGDVPYSDAARVTYGRLLSQAAKEDFAFLMHVGDTKSQSAPCTDEETCKIRDLFREHPTPVVYTFGDNEWTDCLGVGADPLERLAKLREVFFKDEEILRLNRLNTEHQSEDPDFATYVENYRFIRSNVMLVVVHVCGSGNGRRVDHPPSMQEFRQRNKANQAFLDESFALATTKDVAGVVIVIHANPDFEHNAQEGFQDFIGTVRRCLDRYEKPVVCIHGDSHYFRIDKPLQNSETGRRYLHFTRMEVFGSPDVAGVVVTVDPARPNVFSFEPYYLNDE